MKPAIDYTLYLCTDRGLMSTPILEEAVESAIQGGVNEENCTRFNGTGIEGLAVVSAIIARPDVKAAAARLKELFRG